MSVEATLISTVYNEGEEMRELLDSVVEQTRTPEEAIFVDGGSTDNTQEIIQEYAEEYDWIKLIVEEGANIAEGRNIAVENASNDYIVSTDGGCVLEPEWYQEMCEALEENEFVVGMWRPRSESLFEKVQGRIIASSMSPEEVRKGNRSASSRSVGFSKKVWEEVGGYPEELYTGEDSKFNAEILAKGYEQGVAEDAWVNWRMRPTWKSLWNQFKTYGEGDAKGGNLFTHHSKKFGVTKNLLLLIYMKVFLFSLAGFIFSLYYSQYTVPVALLTGIEFLAPFVYEKNAIVQSLREEGLKGFLIALTISQIKVWAWFIGFAATCLKKPSLILYQLHESGRMK